MRQSLSSLSYKFIIITEHTKPRVRWYFANLLLPRGKVVFVSSNLNLVQQSNKSCRDLAKVILP
jgi:hypothetical protein